MKTKGVAKLGALLLVCCALTWWALCCPLRTVPPALENIDCIFVRSWAETAGTMEYAPLADADAELLYEKLQTLDLKRKGMGWGELQDRVVYYVNGVYEDETVRGGRCWAGLYCTDDGFFYLQVSNSLGVEQSMVYQDQSGNYQELLLLLQQLDKRTRCE